MSIKFQTLENDSLAIVTNSKNIITPIIPKKNLKDIQIFSLYTKEQIEQTIKRKKRIKEIEIKTKNIRILQKKLDEIKKILSWEIQNLIKTKNISTNELLENFLDSIKSWKIKNEAIIKDEALLNLASNNTLLGLSDIKDIENKENNQSNKHPIIEYNYSKLETNFKWLSILEKNLYFIRSYLQENFNEYVIHDFGEPIGIIISIDNLRQNLEYSEIISNSKKTKKTKKTKKAKTIDNKDIFKNNIPKDLKLEFNNNEEKYYKKIEYFLEYCLLRNWKAIIKNISLKNLEKFLNDITEEFLNNYVKIWKTNINIKFDANIWNINFKIVEWYINILIQNILKNSVKHWNATNINIKLNEKKWKLLLSIEDNWTWVIIDWEKIIELNDIFKKWVTDWDWTWLGIANTPELLAYSWSTIKVENILKRQISKIKNEKYNYKKVTWAKFTIWFSINKKH